MRRPNSKEHLRFVDVFGLPRAQGQTQAPGQGPGSQPRTWEAHGLVSADKTSGASLQKRHLCLQTRHLLCLQTRYLLCQQTRHLVVSQDISRYRQHRGLSPVVKRIEMSWETTDVLSADTTDIWSADTTDVLPAETQQMSCLQRRNRCLVCRHKSMGFPSPSQQGLRAERCSRMVVSKLQTEL